MAAWIITLLMRAVPVIAAAGIAWFAYSWAWERGNDACQAEWDAASAKIIEQRDAELEVARIKGDALSRELGVKERQYGQLKAEYLAYANAITGVCDPALGVLVSAASAGKPLPPAARAPAHPPAAVDTAPIAANIAENYARAWDCFARYNALLDWHVGPEKAVK